MKPIGKQFCGEKPPLLTKILSKSFTFLQVEEETGDSSWLWTEDNE